VNTNNGKRHEEFVLSDDHIAQQNTPEAGVHRCTCGLSIVSESHSKRRDSGMDATGGSGVVPSDCGVLVRQGLKKKLKKTRATIAYFLGVDGRTTMGIAECEALTGEEFASAKDLVMRELKANMAKRNGKSLAMDSESKEGVQLTCEDVEERLQELSLVNPVRKTALDKTFAMNTIFEKPGKAWDRQGLEVYYEPCEKWNVQQYGGNTRPEWTVIHNFMMASFVGLFLGLFAGGALDVLSPSLPWSGSCSPQNATSALFCCILHTMCALLVASSDGSPPHVDTLSLSNVAGGAKTLRGVDPESSMYKEVMYALKWLSGHIGKKQVLTSKKEAVGRKASTTNSEDTDETFNPEPPTAEELKNLTLEDVMEQIDWATQAGEENDRLFSEYRATESIEHLLDVNLTLLSWFVASTGVLMRGTKFVWVTRPQTRPTDLPRTGYWAWLEKHFGYDPYVRKLLGLGDRGELPQTFDASGGMPWPTEEQMRDLRDNFNVPTHFHKLNAYDCYALRRGTVHMFLNSDGFHVSFACEALLTPVYGRSVYGVVDDL
jgi:hypothetical protein